MRIVEPLLGFGAERLSGELRCHGNFSGGGIGSDKLNLVDADGGFLVVAENFLELLGKVLRSRSAHGESPHQAGEVVESDLVGKQNARQSRGSQQLRKATFGLPRFEWNAIQKKLVVRHPEKKTCVAAFWQSLLQFFPRGLELALGALVIYAIKTRVFDEDVEAVEERSRRRTAAGIGLGGSVDSSLLSAKGNVPQQTKREGDPMHHYGGNINNRQRMREHLHRRTRPSGCARATLVTRNNRRVECSFAREGFRLLK